MDDINQRFLYPLWGSSVIEHKIDLISKSIHLKLFTQNGEKEWWTQIDIYNVRMFCYGYDTCYNKEDARYYSCSPNYKEEPFPNSFPEVEIIPDTAFDESFPEFLKETVRSGRWLGLEEIETAKPGEANVKVFFNYSPHGPSPYYHADQNLVIEFPDSILTVSAEKMEINGNWFIWDQEAGAFLLTETQEGATHPST